MSNEVTVDMEQAQKMKNVIGEVFDGQKAGDVLVALTMATISLSVSTAKSFKSIQRDIRNIEKQLRVKKQ